MRFISLGKKPQNLRGEVWGRKDTLKYITKERKNNEDQREKNDKWQLIFAYVTDLGPLGKIANKGGWCLFGRKWEWRMRMRGKKKNIRGSKTFNSAVRGYLLGSPVLDHHSLTQDNKPNLLFWPYCVRQTIFPRKEDQGEQLAFPGQPGSTWDRSGFLVSL